MLDFNTIAGVSIPFVGTTLGAAMVFFYERQNSILFCRRLCSDFLPG